MVWEIDLALQFEHAVLEHANAADEGSLASFDLPDTMTVGFRETVEYLEQLPCMARIVSTISVRASSRSPFVAGAFRSLSTNSPLAF
jgi:hypothetical protein